jgi:hypothetical protein
VAELELPLDPVVELVGVVILRGPHGVGDALEGVDDGGAPVVHGVDLELLAGAGVGDVVPAVDDRVPHALVLWQ